MDITKENYKEENSDWLAWCVVSIVIAYFMGNYFAIGASSLIAKYEISDHVRTCVLVLTPPFFMVSAVCLVTLVLGRFRRLIEICRFSNWSLLYIPEGVVLETVFFIPLIAVSIVIYTTLKQLEGIFPDAVKYLELNAKAPQIFIMQTDWISFGIFAVVAVIVAPIVEEIIFRGVMFNSLKKYTNQYAAAGITAFIFAAFHFNFIQFIPLFLLGLIFQGLYMYHKSIFPGMIYHAVHNGVAMIFLFVLKFYNIDLNM